MRSVRSDLPIRGASCYPNLNNLAIRSIFPRFRPSALHRSLGRSPVLLEVRKSSMQGVATEATEGSTSDVKWWNKESAENMKDVGSVQELVDELADAGDKLVIVEFYAPWCNACKALYPKLCKIMAEHTHDVVFLKVSFEDNKEMCKNMGVKVLPFFKFFRGAEGKVDQFSCTISKIQKFRDAVADYSSPFCSLEEPDTPLEEFPELHPSGVHHHPSADTITKLAWH